MDQILTAVVLSDVVARRSPAVTSSDRNRLRLRIAVLASVGLDPAVGAAISMREVRRLERTRPLPTGRPGSVPAAGVEGTLVRIADELAGAAESVAAGIEDSQRRLEEDKDSIKASEAELKRAKAQAEVLEHCAEEFKKAVGGPS